MHDQNYGHILKQSQQNAQFYRRKIRNASNSLWVAGGLIMILGHKKQREIAQANPEKKKERKNLEFFLLNPLKVDG